MNYKISIQPEAEFDFEEAFKWYEEKSRGLGSEFIPAFDASLSAIQRSLFVCRIVYREIRRKLMRRFPYGIFYVFESETIYIIAYFHVKRDLQQWQRRLNSFFILNAIASISSGDRYITRILYN